MSETGSGAAAEPAVVDAGRMLERGGEKLVSPRWGVIGVTCAAHLPLLYLCAQQIASDPRYMCVPLVLVAAAVLLWTRRPEKMGAPFRAAISLRFESGLLIVGLLLLTAGVVCWSPWLAVVAAIFTLGSLLIYSSGRRATSNMVWAWLLLWLLVPLPLGWDGLLVDRIAVLTTQLSSAALDAFGVNHVAEAGALETSRWRVALSEKFDGFGSPFFLTACAAVYAVALRRPLIHVCLLLASAPFMLILTTSGLVLAIFSNAELGAVAIHSWLFQLVQVLLFMLAIYSTDGFLLFLLLPVASEQNPLARLWNWAVRAGMPSRRWVTSDVASQPPPDLPAGGFVLWESRAVAGMAACLLLAQLVFAIVIHGVLGS